MSVIANNIVAGAAGQGGDTAYEISRSLRFNSGDSSYLSRTPSSAGNRKTWTFSCWVKLSKITVTGQGATIFDATGNTTSANLINFMDADELRFIVGNGAAELKTSQLFRDVSGWYHIVAVLDTTVASPSSDRMRLYVNGVRVTDFKIATYPSQNTEFAFNNNVTHNIGRFFYSGNIFSYFNGYLADVHFIDGQALAASDFGAFDSNNVWQPIEYAGTYGTNGFYLDFSDNSSNAALGYDAAGSNNWTVNNIAAQAADYVSGFTGTQRSGFEWTKAFDNDLNQGAVPDVNTTWTWTPSTPIAFTTLAIYAYKDSSPGGLEINGTSVISQVPNHNGIGPNQRTVITGISSPLTSIKNLSFGSLANVVFAGLEIDGTILVSSPNSEIDSLVDSPTNGDQTDTGVGGEVVGNYATLNPLDSATTLSNGNLTITGSGTAFKGVRSTIGMSSGKWYMECTMTAYSSSTSSAPGIWNGDDTSLNTGGGSYGNAYLFVTDYASNYRIYVNKGASNPYSEAGSISAGDIIGIALDLDNGECYVHINGTYLNSGSSVYSTWPADTYYFGGYEYTSGNQLDFNFGQRPFAYTAPSGFKALCTANLPDPTIADGSTAMDVNVWDGDGTTNRLISTNFSPDFTWMKIISQSGQWHLLADSVRGGDKTLSTNNTNAEVTRSGFVSFDSTGFTIGDGNSNPSGGQTLVGFAWDGGTSTVSNTDGSITSSVRVNPSAGFSIVSYTGNGTSPSTIGHGLNAVPGLILLKNRSSTQNWAVYHTGLIDGSTVRYLRLNTTDAQITGSGHWQNTVPTSSVFTVGNDNQVNANGNTYIAYCFSPVSQYSSFGSYIGNGSSDGTFVYTGHRSRFLLIKASSIAGEDWVVLDTERDTYNTIDSVLFANDTTAELTNSAYNTDILSNGFKLRGTNPRFNANGVTYIFASFASHPFKTARAR